MPRPRYRKSRRLKKRAAISSIAPDALSACSIILRQLHERVEVASGVRLRRQRASRLSPEIEASRFSATSCDVNALVDATPISGPGVRVDGAFGLSRGHAADDVADRRCCGRPCACASRSAASVSAVSPDCVMTTASVVASTIGVAVAILRAVIDLDRQPGQLLDQELADQRGMPRGAARQDRRPCRRSRSVASVMLDLLEEHAAAVERHAAEQRFARRRAAARRSP